MSSISPELPTTSLQEAYGLSWPGKSAALAEAFTGPKARLGAAAFESPHLFIEGDNLDGLKALKEGLGQQVAMIYIDPPYNTGTIWAYDDQFRSGARASKRDDEPLARHANEGARRHANWLSMMLPRLIVARDLLREDGAIFVSIDDRESPQLRLLLDEVFGAENFVSTITWRKKVVRGRGARHILPQTEYIHVYAKRLESLPPFLEPLTEAMRDEYGEKDELGPYKLIPLAKSGTSHSPRPNLVYPITAPDGTQIPCPTHQWRWSRETLEAKRSEIVFKKSRTGKWIVYTKQRLYVDGVERQRTPLSYYDRATTTDGTREMKALFGRVVLDFPKPVKLLKDLIAWALPPERAEGAVVLDFFAGSCSTAHAVLELNQEDGGDRRFICIQRPEPTDQEDYPTIAEIGKERIRRVMGGEAGLQVVRL